MLKSTPRSDRLYWYELFRNSSKSGKIALLLSSWFGVGLLRGGPGTAAAFTALPMAFAVKWLGLWAECVFLAGLVCVAYWSCGKAWRMVPEDDPQWVVIDEVVGILLALLGLSAGALELAAGFILFRIFDILKPYPIGRMERLPGAKGILMDDLLAGLFANLCVRMLHLLG